MNRGLSVEDVLREIELVTVNINTIEADKPNLLSFYERIITSNNMAEVYTVIGERGPRITHATDNIVDILGYTPEELKGTYILDYRVNPLDRDILNHMITLLDRGESVIKTSNVQKKNGEVVRTRAILFKDGDRYVEFVWKIDNEFDLG